MAKQTASVPTARLFDADKTDQKFELSREAVAAVGERKLLWVDVLLGDDATDGEAFLEMLPFGREEVTEWWDSTFGPRLTVHGDYFLARVAAIPPKGPADEQVVLDLAVGKNVILTAHREPVEFLNLINKRITADTTLGEIDATDFATVLLEGLVTSYLEVTDVILAQVDKLDRQALKAAGKRDLLTDLVDLRHRIASTRRVLVAHRPVIAGLAGADFKVATRAEEAAAPRFTALTEHFEGAISAIDAAREALIGTFDIHMSRTAQRTNDVMKILTITSVLLLPTGVIAGFMGMNIKAPYTNDDPTIFWFVLAGIIVIAVATLAMLRIRNWL
jgi:magnesium transporter